jgi:predicted GNAT family acetyltransferase
VSPHPLDRTAWNALGGRQAQFAICDHRARRFRPEIGPIAAVADNHPHNLQALAGLAPSGTQVFTVEYTETPTSDLLVQDQTKILVQMVAVRLTEQNGGPVVELTDEDSPEMLALALLTEPGPFGTATHHLGQFIGVKVDGRLVAMAGERMKVDGFSEVSGVCTHPDFQGRGYARMLSHAVAKRIFDRGETPFLHAFESNIAAVGLYEKLGFTVRARLIVTMLNRL